MHLLRRRIVVGIDIPSSSRSRYSGFTIVELLVVISVISILMSLLIPAIMSARTASRRLQCQNNLHNLGIAMTAELGSTNRFPPAGTFDAVTPDAYYSWVVPLLSWLDRADIDSLWDRTRSHMHPINRDLRRLQLAVLVCPDDITAVSGEGNLSYVVNGGFGWTAPIDIPVTLHPMENPPRWAVPFDFNGNGIVSSLEGKSLNGITDREVYLRTALFFCENLPVGSGTVRHHRTETVTDGLSNTMMFAENVRTGYDPAYPEGSGWANPEAWRNSFFLSSYVCRNDSCSAGNVDYQLANSRGGSAGLEAINASLTQAEGQAPWPSSYHPGGVHFTFADGRVKFISQELDGRVYAALISPRGSTLTGPLAQMVLSDNDY